MSRKFCFLKRILDFAVALAALVALFPLWGVVLAALCLENKGKPFFIQNRPGKDEKEIRVIKFKTMNDKRGEDGELLPGLKRVTKIGALIRAASLDELPQLINVLKGDMSLVGPRPLLFKYLPLYNERQKKRHDVLPGITGWAQVNGRNAISWKQKFEYDVWYVENLSFVLDLKILGMTMMRVLRKEGINSSGDETMPPFDGTN